MKCRNYFHNNDFLYFAYCYYQNNIDTLKVENTAYLSFTSYKTVFVYEICKRSNLVLSLDNPKKVVKEQFTILTINIIDYNKSRTPQ